MTTVLDVVGLGLLTLGCFMALSAGIAQARFADVASRMHAAAKPQVFGLVLVLGAVAVMVREPAVVTIAVLAVALQLATSPVSSHMVTRAAYRYGHLDTTTLAVDELGDDLDSGALTPPPTTPSHEDADREEPGESGAQGS